MAEITLTKIDSDISKGSTTRADLKTRESELNV